MYFEIADEPENTDVCKRMAMHECVLFETQPSATMLNILIEMEKNRNFLAMINKWHNICHV